MSNKVTLLICTRNEVESMKVIMPQINPAWVDEVLIIDKSTDGTAEYAQSLGYKVIHQKSGNLAGAYIEGAAAAQGDFILTFSPDGNSIPELIPQVVEKVRQGFDMVVASRYLGNAKSADDDWLTALGNRSFTWVINTLFGGSWTDSLVMYRAWKKETLAQMDYHPGIAGFDPYFAIVAARDKYNIAEIPGDEPARISGIRKMNPFINGAAIIYLIGREFIKMMAHRISGPKLKSPIPRPDSKA